MDNYNSFSLVADETLVLPDDDCIIEAEPQKEEKSTKSVDFIVLAVENPNFKTTKPSYELDIFGKSMLDWVKSVCDSTVKVKVVQVKHNVLEEIKPLLGDAEYTVVLYSDSPLLTKATICEAIDYTISSGINVCKMTHGYILKTEYISRAFDIFTTETHYFNEEDFLVAYNFKQLALITEIAKNRILNFHMQQGVHIVDPSTTFIGSEVSFGKDIMIYPNNNIYGKMEVGDGVTFFSDNLIGDCILKDNCSILRSRVKKSVIGKNVKIGYSSVDKTFVGDNVDIRTDSKVTSCELAEDVCVIGATLFNAVVGKNSIINSNAVVVSYKDEKVIIKDNVIIGVNATIPVAVCIGSNSTILPTSTIRSDVPASSICGDYVTQTIKPKN